MGGTLMSGIFISDFDNTLTLKDFYWIVIDDYIGEKGKAFYREWKKEKKINVDFLNTIFGWHTFSEEEHEEILDKVELSQGYNQLVGALKEIGWDFLVLSAGFDYYIKKVLPKYGIDNAEIISNRGRYENGRFLIDPDPEVWFYSDVYGVDKEKVVKRSKDKYDRVFFAGDSEPDFLAAKAADVRFAKEELAALLEREGIDYYPYENFEDIARTVKDLIE